AAAAATGTLATPVGLGHSHENSDLASAHLSVESHTEGEHHHHGVSGTVASVNGSTDPSACGTGDTGSFTLTGRDGKTFTVNVSPTTTFVGHHDGSDGASFADVCVGNKVGAKGDVTDTTVASAMVIVTGDHMGDHQGDHEGDDNH